MDAAKDHKPKPDSTPKGDLQQSPSEQTITPLLQPQAALLQLQRRYGNRAVQRLLADPAALRRTDPQLAAALQRQERGPVRVPYVLQELDVIINTVGTPQIMANGGFEWLVDFRLPSAAVGDGYIIQECRHNSTDLETGSPLRDEWHYWEAWRMRAGAVEPVDRANNCHDQFRYTVLSTTHRYVENSIRAIVRFYETPSFPWGDSHPANNPTHNFFHDLPQPPIWNGRGVRHEAVCTYDARRRRPRSRLVMRAGSQETTLRG